MEVPTGVLPRKGNDRPGADRLNVILKSQHDLQKKVNKYREGRLSHELNYANDGPVQRQLTKEQKANLQSERNHLECPNPDCSKPNVQRSARSRSRLCMTGSKPTMNAARTSTCKSPPPKKKHACAFFCACVRLSPKSARWPRRRRGGAPPGLVGAQVQSGGPPEGCAYSFVSYADPTSPADHGRDGA